MRSRLAQLREALADRDLIMELRLALKMTLAGTLSWWLATLAGEPRPIFATLVPLVAMSGDPFSAVSISTARVLGVFAGVGIGVGLLHVHLATLALVALGLLLGALAGIVLRVGGRANVQAAISALFLIGLGASGAAHAGVARIWETAIGAGVTVIVSVLLWPPNPVRELRLRLERLRHDLTDDLAAVADDLATGSGAAEAYLAGGLRGRSVEAVREVLELGRARAALRWNPLRRHDIPAFGRLEQRMLLAARLYRHARSIARDVSDADESLRGSASGEALAALTLDLAEATELALSGRDPQAALAAADQKAESRESDHVDAHAVRMQLRQMLADLRLLAAAR
ncbi:MAG: FUSC family protein [Gaiellaceae bacterium]